MDITREQQTYARLAGVMLLVKMALELSGDSVTIIARGGETFAETARFATQSAVLWRVCLLSVAAAWIVSGVVGFALYVVLEPVNKRLAQLALLLRLGSCFVGSASVAFRFAQAWLYRASARPELFTADQLRALSGVIQRGSGEGVEVAWMFQGLAMLLFFLLFLRAGYLPSALARAGILMAVVQLVLSPVMIVDPTSIDTLKLFLAPGLLVEIATAVLLLSRRFRSRAAVEARA